MPDKIASASFGPTPTDLNQSTEQGTLTFIAKTIELMSIFTNGQMGINHRHITGFAQTDKGR